MRTTAIAATAAVLLALAACGGDDSGDDPTTPTTATSASTAATTVQPAADATTVAPDGTEAPGTTAAPGTTEAADDTDAPATDAPTTAAPAGALDVCALLTPADLEAAFGGPWDAGDLTHQDQTGADQCVWGNIDVPPVKTFSLTVYREEALNPAWKDNGLTVASLFAQTKDVSTVDEEIELGDEAYRAGTTIAVLDGETSYSFDTFLGTSDEALAGLRTLAEQVVAAGI